ncbi:MAG: sulfatase [Verrucomicrobiae bacterium]|nr:sulfatase [Verrucomicrobiae bacterium]NNJ44063.1 sulfatase [Akkermansiaceae bacterium]
MTSSTLIRILGCVIAFSATITGQVQAKSSQRPNVVIIFLDDSGYGDFHPFGNPSYPTPNVQKLASEGMRLNKFYVPQAVCSASRSALLSGCFPGRTKVFGAHGPNGKGLDPKFMTMAEMFKRNGYATAHFGKWHCGDTPQTRPTARGFDEHAGLMYSNDMWNYHPKNPKHWGKHPLQYWENSRIKIKAVSKKDQTQLTTWSTDYAVDFIHRNSKNPFFLYLAHSMPHVPIFCSDKFLGKSGVGLYGDVMMELDWSVGEVMKAIKNAGIEKNTILIFSSDNGPWSEYGDHAGVTPFREHKTTSFDGGIRSATIMKYPGKIQGGSGMNRIIGSVDLLPTLAQLTHSPLPDNEIDGKNVWPLISGSKNAENPHDYYPVSSGRNFEAVISGDGRWKLHLPHKYRHVTEAGKDGMPGRTSRLKIELSLFDLNNDPDESINLIKKHPDIAAKLKAYAENHKKQFYR